VNSTLIKSLRSIVSADAVKVDERDRRYYSRDLFFEGETPSVVVSPGSQAELADCVRTATESGSAVIARGGGLSYTKGYVPVTDQTVLIDMRRLNAVVVNPEDRVVTAEAGATWEDVYIACEHHGLRIPFFGTAVGAVSTIGGALAQNAVFFGSGKYGTAADNVLGLRVVLADGRIVPTGSESIRNGTPFFRHHGPDLTGIFLSDGGALGIKSEASFRLIDMPREIACASFALRGYSELVAAAADIARTNRSAECFGVAQNPFTSSDGAGATLHVVVEGYFKEEVDRGLNAVRSGISGQPQEIDPVVPNFVRSNPFEFVTSVLDAKGRLQSWTHALFPLSRGPSAANDILDFYRDREYLLSAAGIDVTFTVAVTANALVLEPVMYWSDAPSPVHLNAFGGAAGRINGGGEASEATAQVVNIRKDLAKKFSEMGASHMQLGKFYNYGECLDPETLSVLRSIKAVLDPNGLMNPGALRL